MDGSSRMTGMVDDATDSRWFERVARAGHAVSGLVHLVIAYIILRLAFGDSGNADQSGALAFFASSSGGRILLWCAVVAFIGLALWRLAQAILGGKAADEGEQNRDDDGWLDRGKALALCVVYVAFAYSAAGFAMGSGKSSGQQNAGWSARLMENGAGKAVLIVVGLVIIGVGGYHVYKGISRNFLDDLKGQASGAVTALGVIGYAAKGTVLIGAGILVIVAAVKADPSKATGLDGAVKTLAGLPAGQVLLVLAALGIAAYGIYSFVMARWARM